ncbi:hypothetical protein JAAARDRAFT_39292 [Jaapia argillacea MUCL 33604]|uniref:Ketoreductase domain-containing protein n=1 Tax=Jaapia argillacea MUCL 33604 TaxID=933084 RepID=A0A067PFQ0_9AGAM|nr:hypothetical protein JAAARDRAFT_39292 [Jaapia argillacea MUCL 33604]
MPVSSQDVNITQHNDVYPGIDVNGSLKGAAGGKIVYIAGASRGIGAATAHAYALAGCAGLFLTARSLDTITSVASSIHSSLTADSSRELVIETDAVDVTDLKAVGESVKRCVEKFGRIDVLIVNAGYMEPWMNIADCDPIGWWKVLEVNLGGVFNLVHHAVPSLLKTQGHIILLSSVGAQKIGPGASAYGCSKHALNRFAEYIHCEYNAQGIKVFSIHPGGVVTELSSVAPHLLPYLVDTAELPGYTMVRLSSGSEDWLSGRYISCNWDLDELAKRRREIEDGDLLKNRLDVGSLA